jgi:hypothetical protein
VKEEIDVVVGIGRGLEQEAEGTELDQGKQTRSLGIVLEQHGERKTETWDKIATVEFLA